jgi:hypothetical protein
MPRDGTGTYVPPEDEVSTGTPISSASYNASMADITAALTQSLSKDGQTVPTADLQMGGFKLTDLADGSANDDAAALGQIGARFLSSVTVASTPTYVEFALPTTFDAYEIQFSNVTPSANAFLNAQLSRDSGGSWVAGSNYTSGWYGSISPGFAPATSGLSQAALSFQVTSIATGPFRGVMRIDLPAASGSPRWACEGSANNAGTGLWEAATYHGVMNTGTRPDRIRLFWSAGTWLNQGKVSLRGVRT